MKNVPYTEIPGKPADDPAASGVTMRIVIGPKDGAPHFVMRVFTVEPGGHTPRHRHSFEHEVFVHEGHGEAFYEEKTSPMGPGHIIYVPPDALHQFVNTGKEPLVFVCVVPRVD